jgi:hypothetical protein
MQLRRVQRGKNGIWSVDELWRKPETVRKFYQKQPLTVAAVWINQGPPVRLVTGQVQDK